MVKPVLYFTKMHGIGNDFVIIDATHQAISLSKRIITKIAHRHFGIGFDQLLLIKKAKTKAMDYYCQIYNQDGSSAQQCGNGLRCVGFYLFEKYHHNKPISIGTLSGIHRLEKINKTFIKLIIQEKPEIEGIQICKLPIGSFEGFSLKIGNPHFIITANDLDTIEVKKIGTLLNHHENFPMGVNVSFMQIINTTHINLRVFERGVGETLACGSAACAAVIAGNAQQLLNHSVKVTLPGGDLKISLKNDTIESSGPTMEVFQGQISL